MGNEIVDELENQLDDILEVKYPKLMKDIEDNEKVYLDWGDPELYEHSNKSFIEVIIVDAETGKVAGQISFDVKVTWSRDLSFGGWEQIKIIPSTVYVEY